MKRFLLLATLWSAAASLFALEVNNLKTQAYTNPIGIDLTTPSFSWVLSSSERNVMQKSYSIRVSTERDFSDVVWESGTIESDQSADVQATGFTPQARTRYYWQNRYRQQGQCRYQHRAGLFRGRTEEHLGLESCQMDKRYAHA